MHLLLLLISIWKKMRVTDTKTTSSSAASQPPNSKNSTSSKSTGEERSSKGSSASTATTSTTTNKKVEPAKLQKAVGPMEQIRISLVLKGPNFEEKGVFH